MEVDGLACAGQANLHGHVLADLGNMIWTARRAQATLPHGEKTESAISIFRTDVDQRSFLQTLAEACAKTGWQVHAYCLMKNHFHLVFETPRPNLVPGMCGRGAVADGNGWPLIAPFVLGG